MAGYKDPLRFTNQKGLPRQLLCISFGEQKASKNLLNWNDFEWCRWQNLRDAPRLYKSVRSLTWQELSQLRKVLLPISISHFILDDWVMWLNFLKCLLSRFWIFEWSKMTSLMVYLSKLSRPCVTLRVINSKFFMQILLSG